MYNLAPFCSLNSK